MITEVMKRADVGQDVYDAGKSLYRTIGKGYETFWYDRHLYRLVKGSKGSKKSKTVALWFVHHLMKYPQANLLCVRKQANTIRDSMFADLEWAMAKLNCVASWERTVSSMRMTRKYRNERGEVHTQTILFRGLDDPLKAGSISSSDVDGYLCWVWIEEFFEIESEETFIKLTMSIRGELPPETGLWKQYTMTFNPWSATSWIKKRFFDEPDPDVYTLTTTYRCNEWLSDVDRKQYEDLYTKAPHIARIVCDGDWGISEGLVYENWVEEEFDIYEVLRTHPKAMVCFGLDFGYSISYNAFVAVAVDVAARELWVFDEMYDRGMTNLAIARKITEMGYAKEEIWADAAEPKSIYELQMGLSEVRVEDGAQVTMTYTLPRIKPALKGPDSLRNGIQRLQTFRWHVHPKCSNCLIELQNYAFSRDASGNWLERPIKEYDHCLRKGTLVETRDYGAIPIEDVKEGYEVVTHTGIHKVLAAGISRPGKARLWKATFSNGSVIYCTHDHPFPTDTSMRLPLKRMEVGMRVGALEYDGRRSYATLVSVEPTDLREHVYDLTVEDDHTFFANNILTANCLDATRYALSPVLLSTKAHFFEVRGGSASGEKVHSRRVFAISGGGSRW